MTPKARIALAALASLVYVMASQWLMTRTPPPAWSALALIGPMLALAGAWALRTGHRFVAALAALAIAALAALARADSTTLRTEWLWLGQHVVVHLALAIGFGATLASGHRPLITQIAHRVHGQLSPAMQRYTRQVTIAWVLYFIVMAAASLLLFRWASIELWATFANLVTPLAVSIMFVGEYLLRYRLHPEFERASMMDAVRAYLRPAGAAAALPSASAPPAP
jgi:uncharacterized membrane protein